MRVIPWLASLLALAATPARAERPWYEQPQEEHAARRAVETWRSDDLPHPLGQRQRALRTRALQEKLAGRASGKVHQLARGQFVELELERKA
jgi:immune inhibitor A